MLSLVSPDGRVHVGVDDRCGARLASVRVDGFDIVLGDGCDALSWGCYPMAPYAGRVRDATVRLGSTEHPLPAVAGPHALHGTVFSQPWTVLVHADSRAVLLAELDLPWPVAGTVRHEIVVANDCVTMHLDVNAHDDMPCQVGWHPWFTRPDAYTVPFRTVWPRDEHGIATSTPVVHDPTAPMKGTYDDCFSDPVDSPTLTYESPALTVTLDSDCSHWVVYDEPKHAICIEPQSGRPNQVNDDPVWLEFGQTMTRFFRIGWVNTRR